MRSEEAGCIVLRRVAIFATFPGPRVVNALGEHARPGVRGETVQASTCFYAGLCVFWLFGATGCLQPIAPEVLVARLHPRDPARPAVTFVAFGDMGDGSDAQTQVAHAMYNVCQREGCDFVLGLGDNIYPHSVRSVHDPAFQAKFEHPYGRFQGLDFWMILGNHDFGSTSCLVRKRRSRTRSTATAGVCHTSITRFPSYRRGSTSTASIPVCSRPGLGSSNCPPCRLRCVTSRAGA
jgi:Calcineurin-like phosphoesterase